MHSYDYDPLQRSAGYKVKVDYLDAKKCYVVWPKI